MQDHLLSTSSLTLVLNPETAGHPNLWQYARETQIPRFVSICATLIRAVAADALLLGSKNFHLFILTGGSFFFQCQRVQTHESKQNPEDLATSDKLTCRSAVSFSRISKASHNQVCPVTLMKKSLGDVLVKRSKLLCQAIWRHSKNSLDV